MVLLVPLGITRRWILFLPLPRLVDLLLLSARAPYMLLFEYAGTCSVVSLIIYQSYIFHTDIFVVCVTRNTHTIFAIRFASVTVV
jgi:hypothetical protein